MEIIIGEFTVTVIKNNAMRIKERFRDGLPYSEREYGKRILCVYCKQPKFISNRQINLKVSVMHRECMNEYNGLKRKSNIPKTKNIIINCVISQYTASARERKYKFSLSREEVEMLIFNDCYYCGSPPSLQYYDRGDLKYQGIDRVNNTLGYEAGNCVSCCIMCNRAKHNHTQKEFEAWLNRLVEFRNKIEKVQLI